MNYIYDGTFEGLLTSIYEAYYRHEAPERILAGLGPNRIFQASLIDENIYIATDIEKSLRVNNSILGKISSLSLENIYYVHLSELEDVGTWIYNYLRLGFKMGSKIDLHLSDDRVLKIVDTSRKVVREVHLVLGLLRFKELKGGVYYAAFEPDFNITELVAPHFVERLSDQSWIIHDRKRSKAAFYNKEGWFISDFSLDRIPEFSESEKGYQDFWRRYFKSIAVQSRLNPRLQRQHMPKRYWKHLVEKDAE